MTTAGSQSRFDAAFFRDLFDRVYVINLAERTDRRREMAGQLARIGLEVGDPLVEIFAAVRPSDRGDFGSIGERGCFLSHLGVLRDAVAKGYRSILILEDDVDWTPAALAPGVRLDSLHETGWAFLHGGRSQERAVDGAISLTAVEPEQELLLAHFIGMRGEIIAQMTNYLEAILQRPPGSPEGGPMHVDGAYSWFRRAHPGVPAYICVPAIARQRSSKSDISVATGWRATKAAGWARRMLRPFRAMLPRW